MSDSGAPKHWPFEVFDPSDFKVPERRVEKVIVHFHSHLFEKQELAEFLNEFAILEGWNGIAYHFVIDYLGNICTGRPCEEVPMIAEKNESRNIIAIASAKSELARNSLQVLSQSIIDTSQLKKRTVGIEHVIV